MADQRVMFTPFCLGGTLTATGVAGGKGREPLITSARLVVGYRSRGSSPTPVDVTSVFAPVESTLLLFVVMTNADVCNVQGGEKL